MDGDDGFLSGGVDGLEFLAVHAFGPFPVDESEIFGSRLSAWGTRNLGCGLTRWGKSMNGAGGGGPCGFAAASPTLTKSGGGGGGITRMMIMMTKKKFPTHSPVGCSYLPVAGVSNVFDKDIIVF